MYAKSHLDSFVRHFAIYFRHIQIGSTRSIRFAVLDTIAFACKSLFTGLHCFWPCFRGGKTRAEN